MSTDLVASRIAHSDVVKHFETGGKHPLPSLSSDPAEVAARIDAEIFGAKSADELFGSRVVLHAQDYVGKPFQLTNAEWRPSDMGDGVYAVLSIVDTNGEIHTMTTGARSICMKVAKAAAEGWLPVWVEVTESTTANGNTVLDLQAAPEPF